jgi:transposase
LKKCDCSTNSGKNQISIDIHSLENLEAHLSEVESQINSFIHKYDHQIELIDGIPGIDKIAASTILAEIGTDMSKFKTAEHICSWAELSPGNNQSAGKKKTSKHQ